ncbi:hypothetical protein K501DRAFT_276554 [Backusella circina FSU 941]|nr:hypothetical protein K501DRAFT_276554 [Backusella circina FSU 941]
MLPFDYTLSNPNIAIAPAVIYTLLLIFLAWVYIGRRYGDRLDDIFLSFIVAITGIINASLMIAFGSWGYNMWKVALVFYFISAVFTWIIGIRNGYRLVVYLNKNPKTLLVCRNILNISYWISVGLVGVVIAVGVFIQGTKYELGLQTGIASGLSILVLALFWMIIISYFCVLYYSFKLVTRSKKETLIVFGVLNTIAAVGDTLFMATNFTFFDDVAAGFILFFVTDFLSVISLVISTLAWKSNFYEEVQSNQTV